MPKITKRLIDNLEPSDSAYIVWDDRLRGFGARVNPNGRITFILKYRVGGGRSGTVRKPSIGIHGKVTADQARRVAGEWLSEVTRGGDPGGERQADTVATLCERYMGEHAAVYKRPSSQVEDRRLIEKRILPALGTMKVTAVTATDVRRLHQRLRNTPYEANRMLSVLSTMMKFAEGDDWKYRPRGSNPCTGIKRFKERKRERYLSAEELARLGDTLSQALREGTENPNVIACIRLLILTGARLGEILTLRWGYVDFKGAALNLPESKTGEKVIQLNAPALELLQGMQPDPSGWVIPGKKEGTHLCSATEIFSRP